ncbi:MAG: sulfatase family protein, partial [Planctomycetota bacterium]
MSLRTPLARLARTVSAISTISTVSTAIPIVVAFAGCLVEHSHAGPPGGDGDTPPNLVVVFVDDLGYGDLGCYGGEIAPTPRLDALAAEGLRATDFSVAQPVCSASRAALLTGRYPHRIGIVGALGPGADRGLDDEVVTLAELCRDRGYATALYGKWHLGDREPFLPTQHGFDEWWGIPYSNDMWPRHPESPQHYPPLPLREGDADGERLIETNPDQRRFTTEIADRGADFIRRSVAADRPFLLYLPHPMPHVPLFTSKAGEGRGGNGLYSDVVAEIDASVGTILDTLDETGVAENTFVVFASDNGPWLSYGDRAGTAGPLREGKGTTFEGGVRVPWIARWPGRFPEGETIDAPFNAIDMLPTFADAIGAAAPFEVEGRSVLASLENPEGIPLDRGPILYWYHAPGGGQEVQAVRDGRWKLHLPHRYRSMEGREVGPHRPRTVRSRIGCRRVDRRVRSPSRGGRAPAGDRPARASPRRRRQWGHVARTALAAQPSSGLATDRRGHRVRERSRRSAHRPSARRRDRSRARARPGADRLRGGLHSTPAGIGRRDRHARRPRLRGGAARRRR